MNLLDNTTHKLCFITDSMAWFTNNWDETYGEGWCQKPYDDNAGDPYEDEEPGRLIKIMYENGYVSTPEQIYSRCPFSVTEINQTLTPWLIHDPDGEKRPVLFAGASIREFIEFIENNKGLVFISLEHAGIEL